jgi:hypothetical protein
MAAGGRANDILERTRPLIAIEQIVSRSELYGLRLMVSVRKRTDIPGVTNYDLARGVGINLIRFEDTWVLLKGVMRPAVQVGGAKS